MSYAGVLLIGSCYLLCAFFLLVWWAGLWEMNGREFVGTVMYLLMPFVFIAPVLLVALEAGEEGAASIDWPATIGSSFVSYIFIPLIVLAFCRIWPFGPTPWARHRRALKEFREKSGGVDPSLYYVESRKRIQTLVVCGLVIAPFLIGIGYGMSFSDWGRALQARSPSGGYFELGIAFIFFGVLSICCAIRGLIRLGKAGPLDENAPHLPEEEVDKQKKRSLYIVLALFIKHFFK